MTRHLTIALTAIALTACGSRAIVPDSTVVVRNGTVIDGTGAAPRAAGVVVLRAGRVVAVGDSADLSIPARASVVDARGGTIMPGIINAHTHSTANPAVRREFLVDGVTTVCNVGTRLDRLGQFDESGTSEGPSARAFWAGPIITAPGGYPGPVYGFDFARQVGSPAEARDAVVDLVNLGASMIKIALAPGDPRNPWPIPTLEQVRAITHEAHRRDVIVRAHVFELWVAKEIVLPAAVDVIEHLPLPDLTDEEADEVLAAPDPMSHLFEVVAPAYDSLLAQLVASNVAMVPTLSQLIGDRFEQPDRSRLQRMVVDAHLEAVRRFRSVGGIVALGNDYGASPGHESGMPLREMRLLMASGFTPMEVIEAGTRHAAYVCGHGRDLGTLEPGKLADVIVVDGDPLAEIEVMGRVRTVILGGEIVR